MSSLCSPIHMSTPSDVVSKVNKNRLSKGRGRNSTPKQSKHSPENLPVDTHKMSSKRSHLAARNGNVPSKIEHKQGSTMKPAETHPTQSKSRFQNLLADSDSDTDGEDEKQKVNLPMDAPELISG